ncbi:MAG: hypothetical protein EBS29_07900 [Chloroflexia bacterium]|nr:hypothetical protein [Chloroflexia bacterium]
MLQYELIGIIVCYEVCMSQLHSDPNPPIDVAAVITALHDRLQQHTHTNAIDVSFADEELQDLQDALHEMELTRVISAHLPIKNTGIFGRFVTLAQKIIRRGLRWYINPIVEQQNMYNDAVMRTMQALVDAYQTHRSTTIPPSSPPPTIAPDTTINDAPHIQTTIARLEQAINPADEALVSLVATRQQLMTVHTHWPLPVRKTSDQLANAFHRVQRIGLRWYINPIVAQLNEHNRTTHEMFNLYYGYTIAMRISIAQLKNQLPYE